MHRRHLLLITLSCLLCLLVEGCSSQSRLSKADIEAKLKDKLKLTTIQLTETEPGKYEGTGASADGSTHKVKASYSQTKKDGMTKHELSWEAENPKGHKTTGNETWGGNQ
jgi:hypothetical protein